MPSAIVLVVACVAASVAAVTAADRLLAAIVVRQVVRRVGAASNTASPPVVRIGGVPFLSQLVAGSYREVEVSLAAFTVGGVEFSGLTARLTGVRAPLGRLRAGSGLVAGQVTATATISLAALRRRLPQGLTLRRRGGELAISGFFMLMPVSGVLSIRADPRRISVTPKVLGVPSLVGFVIGLQALPPELAIDSVHVTDRGLEVSLRGDNVTLGTHSTQLDLNLTSPPGVY